MKRRENKKQDAYNAYSKKRLKFHVYQKFTTALIAALDAFERNFGHLWGGFIQIDSDGEEVFVLKPEHELTEQELINREIWDVTRTELLDRGHDQRRYLEDELSRYTCTWNKYQINFKMRRENGNDSIQD